MKLPLLISLPHTGLRVPPEAEPYCALTPQQIEEEADDGADAIYALEDEVAAFVTTDVTRVIVDLNRAEDDRGPHGVVKTRTFWNEPVYGTFPPNGLIESLLARYYRPYHARLTELGGSGLRLGVDCHTMDAQGPPVGPDPGRERPWICLGNAGGTCPDHWLASLAACFEAAFDHSVSLNAPFKGGYIVRTHAAEMPWVQLELSEAPFMSLDQKRSAVLTALRNWCNARPARQ
ncbi:MAG: N-formylglutamate amidohydrolase [bacterium]|nr:N-formylglutamate amidohydrolase [bacterium]